jgi:GDP-4-dehydro-6-deoxy-D-mannose reductase
MKQPRIMITGAGGFLGGALAEWIEENQKTAEIFKVSRRADSKRAIRSCDLNQTKKLSQIISRFKPDIIFHAAGGRGVDEQDLFRKNVQSTFSLFQAIAQSSSLSSRVVLLGSAAEYGIPSQRMKLISEDFKPKPKTSYGLAKLTQTTLGQFYSRQGIDVICTRIFNVSGRRMRPDLSLGNFAFQISSIEKGKQKPVIKTGSLEGKRDFLDVDDICSALWAVARRGKTGELYNICSSKPSRVRDLLEKMVSFSTVKNIVINEGAKTSGSFDAIGDNRKLRVLGWKIKVSLERSLRETLDYYRQQ